MKIIHIVSGGQTQDVLTRTMALTGNAETAIYKLFFVKDNDVRKIAKETMVTLP